MIALTLLSEEGSRDMGTFLKEDIESTRGANPQPDIRYLFSEKI